MASAALKSGYHVVCDKPVTHDLSQALSLQSEVSQAGLEFALTHNYTGYPMVREARELVRGGTLGQLRRVDCSYLQGWLAQPQKHSKQAEWRTDPARAGAAGCFGDIGSHAENLVSFVTGLEIESLCADLSTFVDGRRLDDDGNVLLRFHGGARGIISASQIAAGKENDLSLKVFGERGGLEWAQADPNTLTVRWADKPIEVRRTAGPGVSAVSASAARVPAGHPEGYLEAFAEIYRNFYGALRGSGRADFPRIADGVRGLRFIDRVVASSAAGGVWRELEEKQ
jgi:predicted dehydrogenase